VLERAAREADAVVHAAAVIIGPNSWDVYARHNVRPVEVLARAAATAGVRFVHLSSVAVYGRRSTYDGGRGSVAETFGLDRPLFDGDHYARSKREAELALWRVAEETGLRAAALRPCVIYGEGDRTFSPRVAAFLRRGFAPLIGDGRNVLSAVYAGNVAAAVLAALDRPAACGPFNVANDGALTQHDFVERFAAGLGRRVRAVRVPRSAAWGAARVADSLLRAMRPGAPMTTLKTAVQWLANENPYVSRRAAEELGWRTVTDAGEAAERTGRSFRSR
jgi:nucleoside-diphosphate-sugar epimerase